MLNGIIVSVMLKVSVQKLLESLSLSMWMWDGCFIHVFTLIVWTIMAILYSTHFKHYVTPGFRLFLPES